MALTFFSGFETQDFSEWSTVTGSPAVQETVKHTGESSMRCDTTGGADRAYVTAGFSDVPQLSMYMRVDTAPDYNCAIMGSISGSGCYVDLTTDRYLKLYDGSDNLIGASAFQLVLGTQYRVSFSGDNSRNGAVKLFINGSQEASGNVADHTTERSHIDGIFGLRDSVTADIYVDDVAIGNATDLSDLGDIRVLGALPDAPGEYNEFDTISGFGNCDEIPTDDDVTYVDDSGVGSIHRECYNLQSWADIGGDSGDTIKAVNVWIRYDEGGGSDYGIIVRDDSTDYTTLTGSVGKVWTWKNKLYDTNAPRAAPWSVAIFDAFQAGGYCEDSKDMYMSTVIVMVAYTPEEAPPEGWTHKYLGVANANIGKICGVAIADIGKVNGVA